MNVTPDLDTRFRAAALAEGLVDVRYDIVDSPVGPLHIAGTDRGLARISYRGEGRRTSSRASSGCGVLRSPLDDVRRELDEYFQGTRREFDLPLDLRVAPFHADVLRELARVPVRPHRDLRRARREGRASEGRPCRRNGDEPQPDPDRPPVPPHRRRERLADRLRGRARREAAPARARGCDLL